MPRVDGGVRRGTRLSSGLLGGRIWGNKNYYITIMSEGIGGQNYLLINQSKRRNGIRCQNCIEKCQSHGSCPDDEVVYVNGSGRRCRCHLVEWMDVGRYVAFRTTKTKK